ncbi:MAG: hypothetical protein II777_09040 [Clostridia bacterium]|nr:hypothetical protein [Clostridia bacterium]
MELYAIFLTISIAVLSVMIAYRVISAKKIKNRDRRTFTNIQWVTVSVFAAAVLMFIPLYYNYPSLKFGDGFAFIRPFIISVHSTLRLFILDGEFDTVIKATKFFRGEIPLHVLYNLYAAVIYATAPILTFINVILLFEKTVNKMRYYAIRIFGKNRTVCIFSELNERSVIMAESIYENAGKNDGKAGNKISIVFTDVYEKENVEKEYDLLMRAKDIKALLLKSDITRIESNFYDRKADRIQKLKDEIKALCKNDKKDGASEQISKKKQRKISKLERLTRKSGNLEIFIDGGNDTENIEQLLKLNEIYKRCWNRTVSIYIFSFSATTGYILDSIDKGDNTVNVRFREKRKESYDKFLKGELKDEDYQLDGSYYVRRINPLNRLALNTLSDTRLARYLLKDEFSYAEDDKTAFPSNSGTEAVIDKPEKENKNGKPKKIDILIVGCGTQGKAFLKTALWLYQRQGYLVNITVMDQRKTKDVAADIRSDCPELVINDTYNVDTDAAYRINVFGGADVLKNDINSFFDKKSALERMNSVKAVFVTLGDDDKNTEAAIKFRKAFDRIKIISKKELHPALPLIYTVVYDEKKASNLQMTGGDNASALRFFGSIDYCGEKYNTYFINFIGSLQETYSYDIIADQKKTEKDALKYHLQWIRTASELRKEYNRTDVPGEMMAEHEKFRSAFRNIAEPTDNNGVKKAPVWGDEKYYEDTSGPEYKNVIPEVLSEEIRLFDDFEYPRNSSIAKAKQRKLMEDVFGKEQECPGGMSCNCRRCKDKRINEHMRWNMYMRASGFRYNARKDYRAQFHKDIVPWTALPLTEQYKD